jgi:HAD superfamily phosphatase (TIGR01668 family)
MLRPKLVVETLSDVESGMLRARGIRGVLVDMDDTLLASREERIPEAHSGWIRTLAAEGYVVALLSNGEPARVARVAAELDVEGLSLSGKPFPWAYRRGLRMLGLPADEVAMVGDQVFTDVFGANLAGMTSILVRPLSAGKWLHTRLARHLERLVLRGGDHGGSVYR